ncbi:MAG: peptide-N-glycosidase F-related protein [Bacteroidota bacterium]|nr:peptide-N-glycosidase F-related protein [Bacteroidota bacterium]MDP4233892.1 peptide-N-glycosidase F-related protein [Bacteroidota bacterium]MDP4243564.1 peptide-N-glycosidase F-related protein [Bacteroidota bacterium]MDP4289248.1 peptide-N-glycosidase F-related protein [Bacteroidota bacterium]
MPSFRRFLLILTFLIPFSHLAMGQDTVVVQTLTYDSIGRAGFFQFPDTGSFEKVLLEYRMRCHHALISNGNNTEQGCGQWDYNCETFLWDSTRTDSLKNKWPSATISNWPQNTNFPYTLKPSTSVIRRDYKTVSYSPLPTFTNAAMGKDSTSTTGLLSGRARRTFYLFKAAELQYAGLKRGLISRLAFRQAAPFYNDILKDCRIRMRLVRSGVLQEAWSRDTGFVEVWRGNASISKTPSISPDFMLYNPVTWDSVSDILVEVSFTNSNAPGFLLYAQNGTTALTSETDSEFALSFGGSEGLPLARLEFDSISKQVTVAFWALGDTTRFPGSNSVFMEGLDSLNHRQVNIHMPWGDNQIYWDCGGDASGNFDRIQKTVLKHDAAGRWNHWAFTKNATTGKMAIYLNGSLWMSDTGKHRPIDISRMSLGMAISSGIGYYGDVRQFAMFDTALDSNHVRAIMQQDSAISSTSGLICYFPLNESKGSALHDKATNTTSTLVGIPVWDRVRGAELPNNFAVVPRADMTFYQAPSTQGLQIADTYVYDTVPNHASMVTDFRIEHHYEFHVNDVVVPLDTSFKYSSGRTYTFDELGRKVDSVNVPAQDTVHVLPLNYFTRSTQKFELMSFVTPYGIGLDLGKNGKMWEFDVTDYLPVLKGGKRLTMERGSGQEEFDLRFLFIKGTPTRNVLDMQQVWPMTEENYQTIQADDRYEPRMVYLEPQAKGYKIRSFITGHGQQGEFIGQTHYISVNKDLYERYVWKECSSNPLYPQGGTWPLNRSGWCPGAATDLGEFEITGTVKPGDSAMLDYGVEDGSGDSRYDPSTQLVSYGAPNFKRDAAIMDIWRPSDRMEYARINPACDLPIVVIRNNGSEPLDSVHFDYYVDGGPHRSSDWYGKLAFLDTISIALPVDSLGFWASDSGKFHVDISLPNGGDEYEPNNHFTSNYAKPVSYKGVVVVNTLTNKDPTSYTLTVTDMNGNPVLSHSFDVVTKQYYDSLILPVGCYTLRMDDANEEGLSFWADPPLGNGALRLHQRSSRNRDSVVKTIGADFGKFTQMDFSITQSSAAVNSGEVPYQRVALYPNPAHAMLHVELDGYPMQMMTFEISDVRGAVVRREQRFTNTTGQLRADVDTHNLAPGSYEISITTKDGVVTRMFTVE